MKRFIFTMFMACAMFASVNAQSSQFDDEENPGGWNFNAPFISIKSENGQRRFGAELSSSFSFGFIAGVNQASGVSIDMGQSYEIEWGNVISTSAKVGRHGLFRIGMGFDWRNYRMTNQNMFLMNTETKDISVAPYPEGSEPKFSRIHTFSLSFPVKYYHQLGKKVYFAVGPELYYTPHASLKTRYSLDGEKQKITQKNFHFNRFSVGVGAELMLYHIGVYYKYNPFNVLNTNYGPEFSSMTVGFKLGFNR